MKLIFSAGFLLCAQAFATAYADTIPPSAPEDIEISSYLDEQINLLWTGSGDDGWDGKAARYVVKSSPTQILDENQWQLAKELKLELTSKADEKRMTGIAVGNLGDRGFLSIRAQDDAGNLSDLAPSVSFNIINAYGDLLTILTKAPVEAVPMGKESDGKELYGCVANYEKDLVPGKYGKHLFTCTIARGTAEINAPAFRLISKNSSHRWVDSAAGGNPVITGRINGVDASICRATIEGGLHLGFFVKALGCNISYGGGVKKLTKFEILVQ